MRFNTNFLQGVTFFDEKGKETQRVGHFESSGYETKTVLIDKNETIVGVRGKFYDDRQDFHDF